MLVILHHHCHHLEWPVQSRLLSIDRTLALLDSLPDHSPEGQVSERLHTCELRPEDLQITVMDGGLLHKLLQADEPRQWNPYDAEHFRETP